MTNEELAEILHDANPESRTLGWSKIVTQIAERIAVEDGQEAATEFVSAATHGGPLERADTPGPRMSTAEPSTALIWLL